MKKRSFAYLIIAAAALSAVNLLVSCTPKRGSSGSSPTSSPRPALAPSQVGAPEEKGLEPLLTDPMSLLAYKERVAPLLHNIKSEDATQPAQYEQFFKIKNWYVGDIDFTKLEKDIVGFQALKNSKKRLAVQTRHAVMISKTDFDKLSRDEQGQALMREFVMSLYLLKFLPFEEWCQVTTPVDGPSNCSDSAKKALDKVAPAEKPRVLNEADIENINFVTAWILQNANQTLAENRLTHVLVKKGFDKRVFTTTKVARMPSLKVSGQELMQAVKKAESTQTMPNTCVGTNVQKVVWCGLSIFEASGEPHHNSAGPSFVFRITFDEKTRIEFSNFLNGEVELTPVRDELGQIIYALPLSSLRTRYYPGDQVFTGHILFRKEAAGLTLESALIKRATVVSTNKARTPICEVSAVEGAKSLIEDTLIVRKQSAVSNALEKQFADAPPFLNCLPRQVIE